MMADCGVNSVVEDELENQVVRLALDDDEVLLDHVSCVQLELEEGKEKCRMAVTVDMMVKIGDSDFLVTPA